MANVKTLLLCRMYKRFVFFEKGIARQRERESDHYCLFILQSLRDFHRVEIREPI